MLRAVQGESGYKTRKTLRRIIRLYETRHAAEPHEGYDKQSAEWRKRLVQPDKEDVPGPTDTAPVDN